MNNATDSMLIFYHLQEVKKVLIIMMIHRAEEAQARAHTHTYDTPFPPQTPQDDHTPHAPDIGNHACKTCSREACSGTCDPCVATTRYGMDSCKIRVGVSGWAVHCIELVRDSTYRLVKLLNICQDVVVNLLVLLKGRTHNDVSAQSSRCLSAF